METTEKASDLDLHDLEWPEGCPNAELGWCELCNALDERDLATTPPADEPGAAATDPGQQ